MREGKNIHFSPVDNKPLCSYSNKFCRQRRLNGFGFCIRHILEDTEAPFRQCGYVTTRNTSQKCLNAIPTNLDRLYCHSHLQVIGAIPKTERKTKGQPTTIMLEKSGSLQQANANLTIDTIANNNNHSNKNGKKNGKKKPKPSSKNFKHTTELPPKGITAPSPTNENNNNNTHSINFIKLNGLSNNVTPIGLTSQGRSQINAASETGKVNEKNNKKSQHQNVANGKKTTVPAQNKATRKKLKNQSNLPEIKNVGFMTIDNRWKAFSFNKDGFSKDQELKRLRELKRMQKLPLFAQPKPTIKNEINLTFSSSSYHGLETKYNNDNLITRKGISSSIFMQAPKVDRHLDPEVRLKNRKEHLNNVKSANEAYAQIIRRAYKFNKKKDNDSKAARDLMFDIALASPKRCAQLLKCSKENSDNQLHKHVNSTNASNTEVNGQGQIPSAVSTAVEPNSNDQIKSSQIIGGGGGSFINNLKHEINSSIPNNGLINFINPSHQILTEFNDDQSILLDDKFCDSSPWMNGGVEMDCDDDEYSLSQTSTKLFSDAKSNKQFCPNSILSSRPILNMNSYGSDSSKLLEIRGQLNKSNQLNCNGVTTDKGLYGSFGLLTKKRRLDLQSSLSGDPNLNLVREQNGLGSSSTLSQHIPLQTFGPTFPSMGHLESALRSPIDTSRSSIPASTIDGISVRTILDSSFEHSISTSQQPDYNDDVADLADSFDLPIDQEIANQASKLLEDNGFTEDDFIDLFPETRSLTLTDHTDHTLGLDFSAEFDASDLDYGFMTNGFPNARTNGSSESISVTPNF